MIFERFNFVEYFIFLVRRTIPYLGKVVILQRDSGRLSRAGEAGARKVGTAQSTILLNRKVSARATASATETYRPEQVEG